MSLWVIRESVWHVVLAKNIHVSRLWLAHVPATPPSPLCHLFGCCHRHRRARWSPLHLPRHRAVWSWRGRCGRHRVPPPACPPGCRRPRASLVLTCGDRGLPAWLVAVVSARAPTSSATSTAARMGDGSWRRLARRWATAADSSGWVFLRTMKAAAERGSSGDDRADGRQEPTPAGARTGEESGSRAGKQRRRPRGREKLPEILLNCYQSKEHISLDNPTISFPKTPGKTIWPRALSNGNSLIVAHTSL